MFKDDVTCSKTNAKLRVAGEDDLLVTADQQGECDDEPRPNCDKLSCLVDTECVVDITLEGEKIKDFTSIKQELDSQLYTIHCPCQ